MNERNFKKIYQTPVEKYLKNLSNIIVSIVLVICFSMAIFSAMFYPAEVWGSSMQPTLNPNVDEHYIVYASELFGYGKGDIVLVDLPVKDKEGIKRLIATSGDQLSFGDINSDTQDQIFLNGELLVENYVKVDNTGCVNRFKKLIKEHKDNNDMEGCDIFENDSGEYIIKLKQGYCIYLGDNRVDSYDCSYFGAQKTKNVFAKVFIIVPYGYNLFTYFNWRLFG